MVNRWWRLTKIGCGSVKIPSVGGLLRTLCVLVVIAGWKTTASRAETSGRMLRPAARESEACKEVSMLSGIDCCRRQND
jgi:hypothetical protein